MSIGSKEEAIEQKFFTLTQDMVPISISNRGYSFICPLPKGYKEVVTKNLSEIKIVSQEIVTVINKQAALKQHPFQNILLGYHRRSKKEQKKLLKEFKITRVRIDDRGVYGVWAGNDSDSGDVYLDSRVLSPCSIHIQSLAHLFEPNTAFCPHNMDYYWQALLTREFCIRYFNWLNKKIFEK